MAYRAELAREAFEEKTLTCTKEGIRPMVLCSHRGVRSAGRTVGQCPIVISEDLVHNAVDELSTDASNQNPVMARAIPLMFHNAVFWNVASQLVRRVVRWAGAKKWMTAILHSAGYLELAPAWRLKFCQHQRWYRREATTRQSCTPAF
jgi:hypothetical protein